MRRLGFGLLAGDTLGVDTQSDMRRTGEQVAVRITPGVLRAAIFLVREFVGKPNGADRQVDG